MTVSELAARISCTSLVREGNQDITDVTNDSRSVTRGALYAALPGDHVDGHRFIDDAIAAGAAAVLCSTVPDNLKAGVAYLRTDQPRLALSEISDVFFGHPSRDIDVIGVTGTDGKSTTVYFLYQILLALGQRSSFLSTAALGIETEEKPNLMHQSTPEAPQVHRTLRRMADRGTRYAVLESTSHGLSMKSGRLAHVTYRAGLFTNLSHEHLEYHGTFENYAGDKANLFRALDRGRIADFVRTEHGPGTRLASELRAGRGQPITDWQAAEGAVGRDGDEAARFGVVNLNSPQAAFFAGSTTRPVIGVSTGSPSGALSATSTLLDTTGTRFNLNANNTGRVVRLSVPGLFNVANALEALAAAALLTGAHPLDAASHLGSLRSVRGRMSIVQAEPFAVVVDYAHTPGSFREVLPFFRELTSGRMIVLFGSAGDRDIEKRPIQGRIAAEFADIIVLTDEDPRSEDPMSILNAIAAGCGERTEGRDLYKIPDRREAIRKALALARANDTLLLLGKGHEASIIYASGAIEWDEIDVVRDELSRRS